MRLRYELEVTTVKIAIVQNVHCILAQVVLFYHIALPSHITTQNEGKSYTLMSDEDAIEEGFQLQQELDLSSYNVDIYNDLLQTLITDNPQVNRN